MENNLQQDNQQKTPKNSVIFYITRYVVPIFIMVITIVIGINIYFLLVPKDSGSIDLGKKIETKDKLFGEYAEQKGGDYLFSKDELERLEKDFLKSQYYGPELSEVNQIVLGNRNVLSPESGVSGLTLPQTKQIFLNIADIKNPQKLSYQDKRDSLFSVLAHEYGHQLTSTYFNNTNKVNANSSVYIGNKNNRTIEYWNQDYLQRFKSILNYSGQYSDKKQNSNDDKLVSYNYSLADLYNYSNNKNVTEIDKKVNFKPPNSEQTFITLNPKENIYIFSQDEVGTRMLQQLMYSYEIFNSSGAINSTRKGTQYLNPYIQDLLMTSNFQKNPQDPNAAKPLIIYPNYMWGGEYKYKGGQATPQLKNKSEDYYTMLLDGIGYGKNISKTWFKNESFTTDGKVIEHYNDEKYRDVNQIKWTGFMEDQADSIKVVDKNNAILKTIPIMSQDYGGTNIQDSTRFNPAFNFFAKKNKTSLDPIIQNETSRAEKSAKFWNPENIKTPQKEYKSYVVKGYVDVNDRNGVKGLKNALDTPGTKMFFYNGTTRGKQVNSLNNFGQKTSTKYPEQYITTYPQGEDNFTQEKTEYWTFFWDDTTSTMTLGPNYK